VLDGAPCSVGSAMQTQGSWRGARWDVRVARAASVARGVLATLRGERAPGLLNPDIL